MAEGPSIRLQFSRVMILTRAHVHHLTGILREAHKGSRWVYESNGMGGWHTRQGRGKWDVDKCSVSYI